MLLGIDTATGQLTVAVARSGEVVCEVGEGPDEAGRPRHSIRLLPGIERCVGAAGGWQEVGRIAVGVGPGSYTGLRIGIATARALAQAQDIPLVGVSTLAAIGRGIRGEAKPGQAALPVLDARRGQAFAALYGSDGEELRAPAVLAPEDLADLLKGLEGPPLAAGDGALRFASELETAGATVAPPDDAVHRVSARHICALGAQVDEAEAGAVEPIYLRAPDAETWLERDRRQTAD